MDVEGVQHRGERYVISDRICEFDDLFFAQNGDDRRVNGIAQLSFGYELVHEAEHSFFFRLAQNRAFAAPYRVDDRLVNSRFLSQTRMRGPFVTRPPVSSDDQNGQLEKPAVQIGAKSQSLADRGPMLSQRRKMQKRIEWSGEMALGVDKRGSLGSARPRP